MPICKSVLSLFTVVTETPQYVQYSINYMCTPLMSFVDMRRYYHHIFHRDAVCTLKNELFPRS